MEEIEMKFVCQKTRELGIRTEDVNKALLDKWLSRFSQEHGALWQRIMDEKVGYGEGQWSTKMALVSKNISNWKGI